MTVCQHCQFGVTGLRGQEHDSRVRVADVLRQLRPKQVLTGGIRSLISVARHAEIGDPTQLHTSIPAAAMSEQVRTQRRKRCAPSRRRQEVGMPTAGALQHTTRAHITWKKSGQERRSRDLRSTGAVVHQGGPTFDSRAMWTRSQFLGELWFFFC